MKKRTTILYSGLIGLFVVACGSAQSVSNEPEVRVSTFQGTPDEEATGSPAGGDADAPDGSALEQDPIDNDSVPATDEELSVSINCPDTFLLGEKLVCEIVSTGAVSGEWHLPGFIDNPIAMETVPGSNAVFIEPTNPSYVGAWFTLTAEVTSADGETTSDVLRFTVESSGEAASLIDELNAVTDAKPVSFATNSAIIESDDLATLDAVTALLIASPDVQIEVGGHTDDVGAPEANQTLSQARAESVVKYLVENGVPASQVAPAGYGPTQPIADNSSEQGRAANRRIDFREVGGSPFISIECPTEFVLGFETKCDIVTANATAGTWRIDSFTDGDVELATIPGTNEIFVEPTNPDFVGVPLVLEVAVTDSSGRVVRRNHDFTIVAE